tara:strand:+ start:1 stop:975 length:975 start_codon:yes stop_codon:yes gene_type:complete
MVFLIIIIGGLTRLTDSGLSMVDWRPILGFLPPLSNNDWMIEFEKYKRSPEYLIVNYSMQIEEFKYIFYWEYFHRLFARLIGFVFLFPLIYFIIKRYISKTTFLKLLIVFLFGLIQAVVGWWMVKSGLVDDPYVSQYRLSFHLTIAIIILSILVWMTLENLLPGNKDGNLKKYKYLKIISLILCLLTIISGSFVSGTDAGKSFNTFPLMDGKFIPEGYLIGESLILNFFENTIAIQFNHRWLAVFTFFWIVIISIYISLNNKSSKIRISCYVAIILSSLQILVGILTLINNVPIYLASIHQANATLLYISILFSIFTLSYDFKK